MKLTALATTLTFWLAACEKPNSAEKAVENIDHAAKKLSEQAEKSGVALEDASITAIVAEPGLKVLQINVDTLGGVVTLTGTVDSQKNSDKAKQIAGAVSGVKQVENRIVVKSPS